MAEAVLDPQIEGRVLEVVSEVLALDGDRLSLDSSIATDLEADSLDQLSLFMALEDEFGGKIPEEEAASLTTLRDVACYVRARMVAAGIE